MEWCGRSSLQFLALERSGIGITFGDKREDYLPNMVLEYDL